MGNGKPARHQEGGDESGSLYPLNHLYGSSGRSWSEITALL
jgi:hypothetical protein